MKADKFHDLRIIGHELIAMNCRYLSHLPLSQVATAYPPAALYRQICSRAAKIQWQCSTKPDRLSQGCRHNALDIVSELTELAESLVFKHRVACTDAEARAGYLEIRRKFLSYGKMSDHLERIFGDKMIRPRSRKRKELPPVDVTSYMPGDYWKTARTNARARQEQNRVVDGIMNAKRISTAQLRKQENLHLLHFGVARAEQAGWYVIHDTLTVNNDAYDIVFGAVNDEFRKYIQRYQRIIAEAGYGSYRAARKQGVNVSDYHQHFAVTEAGDLHGRWHIHVMHLCRYLPRAARDPNAGSEVPVKRSIDCLKPLWPHGISEPMAFRFGANDAYGKLGWMWPLEEGLDNSGKMRYLPLQVGGAQSAAAYLSKYFHKAYLEAKHPWRVKRSRMFGQTELKKAMSMLSVSSLEALTVLLRSRQLTLYGKEIPMTVVNRLAMKEIMSRYLTKPNRRRRLMMAMPLLRSRPSMPELFRNLILGKPSPNFQSIGNLKTPAMLEMAASELRAVLDRMYVRHVDAPFYARGPDPCLR